MPKDASSGVAADAAAADADSTSKKKQKNVVEPTNVTARQEPDSLFARVAASQGYPFVEHWFKAAAHRMDTEAEVLEQDTIKPLVDADVPKAHQHILRNRDARAKDKVLMLSKLAEMHATQQRFEHIGKEWAAAFAAASDQYLKDLALIEEALLDRRAKAEEWTTTGVREETFSCMARFQAKSASLAKRAQEMEALELHNREKESARLRTAFESCLAEVRDVMGWYLRQPIGNEESTTNCSDGAAALNESKQFGSADDNDMQPTGAGKKDMVLDVDASVERRLKELLLIILPSILSCAEELERHEQDGNTAADENKTSEAAGRVKALLAMLRRKYPDVMEAIAHAPPLGTTDPHHHSSQKVAELSKKEQIAKAAANYDGIDYSADQIKLIREEEAIQRQILQHMAGRRDRQAAAYDAHRELAKSASLYSCPSAAQRPDVVEGAPKRNAVSFNSYDGTDCEDGTSSVSVNLAGGSCRVDPIYVATPSSLAASSHHRSPLLLTTAEAAHPHTSSGDTSRTNTGAATGSAATVTLSLGGGSRRAKKVAKSSGDKEKPIGGTDTKCGKTDDQKSTDSVAGAVASRIATSIEEVSAQLGIIGSTTPSKSAPPLGSRPPTAVATADSPLPADATTPSAALPGFSQQNAGGKTGTATRKPRAGKNVTISVTPENVKLPTLQKRSTRSSAITQGGDGGSKKKPTTTANSVFASRAESYRLPAFFKTPLKTSLIAQPPHASLFTGYMAFSGPPPPLPPPTVIPSLSEEGSYGSDVADSLVEKTALTTAQQNMAITSRSGQVGSVAALANATVDPSEALREQLHELRKKTAEILSENVGLEKERGRLAASAPALQTQQQQQQSRRQAAGLLRDNAGAAKHHSSTRSEEANTESIDWFAAAVVKEQQEALAELRAACASRQQALDHIRGRTEEVRGKIAAHDAMLLSAKHYWRTNVAAMRRAKNAQEAALAVAQARAERRRLSVPLSDTTTPEAVSKNRKGTSDQNSGGDGVTTKAAAASANGGSSGGVGVGFPQPPAPPPLNFPSERSSDDSSSLSSTSVTRLASPTLLTAAATLRNDHPDFSASDVLPQHSTAPAGFPGTRERRSLTRCVEVQGARGPGEGQQQSLQRGSMGKDDASGSPMSGGLEATAMLSSSPGSGVEQHRGGKRENTIGNASSHRAPPPAPIEGGGKKQGNQTANKSTGTVLSTPQGSSQGVVSVGTEGGYHDDKSVNSNTVAQSMEMAKRRGSLRTNSASATVDLDFSVSLLEEDVEPVTLLRLSQLDEVADFIYGVFDAA